ncbi:MAG: N-acetylmuramoyl-L-alanine amidase [Acidobacteriia bacterium]|nr:N-acetylmuramoyl-L-alanine amidase [Terriglobia bacterium]
MVPLAPFSAMAAPPSPQQVTPPSASTSQPPPQQAAPPSTTAGRPVIVLDAAHGGTDTGARGETGIVEKDMVLQIARTVRAELERQGYRVVMSRNDDSNPSYDERAAMANAYRDAIFISLHIGSTGNPGTVRAFYDQLATPVAPTPVAAAANVKSPAPTASGLPQWEQAQQPYVEASHRVADLIQAQLAQSFSGSPATATPAAVRGLRSVAAPGVAIEISSVSVPSADSLTAAATPLATAIARGIAASRAAGSTGAN